MRRPIYPAYKDSDIDWLGQIPAHWNIDKIGQIFRVLNGATPSSGDPTFWDGDITWITPDDLGRARSRDIFESARRLTGDGYGSCGTTLAAPNSLVLSTRAPIGHLGIARVPLCVNQGCKILALSKNPQPEYRYYQLVAAKAELVSLGQGSTFVELPNAKLSAVKLAVPPLPEQQAIGEFLDRETARIDGLIAKKRRLIELLREKRQAVISHAVTKGLDPNAPMKPSGIKRLGEIPAHWEIKPLMYLTPSTRQIMYGIVLPGPHFDGGVPIVKGGDVAPGKLRLAALNRTDPEIEMRYERSRLRGGDLVYAIRGSIGAVELVPEELEGANLTQDAARVAPRDGVNQRWLLHALRASPIFGQLEAGAVGATIRGINIRDLKRARLPVPPAEEQRALGAYCDAENGLVDQTTEAVERAIATLEEHRSALIAAAVTGKIDVRECADEAAEAAD